LFYLFISFILWLLLLIIRGIVIVILLSLFYQPHLFLYRLLLGHAVRWLSESAPLLLETGALFAEFLCDKLLGLGIIQIVK
jgi:hypothetical protein